MQVPEGEGGGGDPAVTAGPGLDWQLQHTMGHTWSTRGIHSMNGHGSSRHSQAPTGRPHTWCLASAQCTWRQPHSQGDLGSRDLPRATCLSRGHDKGSLALSSPAQWWPSGQTAEGDTEALGEIMRTFAYPTRSTRGAGGWLWAVRVHYAEKTGRPAEDVVGFFL